MSHDFDQETKSPAKLNLSEAFQSHDYQEWRDAADELLKGVPFEKVMRTLTSEGITLDPLYRRDDVASLPLRQELPGIGARTRAGRSDGYLRNSWHVSQELPYGTPEEFNKIALADLARGQTELNILLDLATRTGQDPDQAAPGRVGACGLSVATVDDLDRALRDVHLEMISLYFRCGSSGLPVAALLFALARRRQQALKELKGCIEIDPLASLARLGKISVNLDTAFDEMAQVTRYAAAHAPELQTIGASGSPYHDGGGNATDELAFTLATAVDYIRQMGSRGLDIDMVAPRIRFSFSIGSNFFMEIAKLRAARLLWARIVEAFGGSEASKSMYIHARSSIWNKSRLDPYTNMLRTTTEAFSGVVGGADGMHVSPFDEVFSLPDDFSRRIARNQQIILAEECELTRTIDPAGGSYYVEWLTNQLAQKAWAVFQEVEAGGGMLKALQAGLPQDRVAQTKSERLKKVQQRRDSLVGVNNYPNTSGKKLTANIPNYDALFRDRARAVQRYRTGAETEKDALILEKLEALFSAGDETIPAAIDASLAGATIGEISRTIRRGMGDSTSLERHIPLARAAQQYEELRAACETYAEGQGHAPKILQANMGPSRFYRVRADWTSAFFEAGGFEVLGAEDFADVPAAVRAAGASGVPIVIITSNDENYPEVVPALAKQLKTLQHPPYVIMAGAPGEKEQEYRAAGVDDFVNVKVNNYEMNRRLLETIGVIAR